MDNAITAGKKAAELATFRAPAARPSFERIGQYPHGGAFFIDGYGGTWRSVHERGHLPSPGAMAYAYMSLGLPPIDVAGRGTFIGRPIGGQQSQIYQPQMIGVRGLPQMAGQVLSQPLTPMARGDINGGGGV